MNILHITDLHIDDVNNTEEKLREKFYEEFLDDLVSSINMSLKEERIDFIITTGDYINKGKTENFAHAEKVLKYLGAKLNLENENIYTCIGNHDIVLPLEVEGKVIESRKFYKDFSLKFNKGIRVSGCDRALVYEKDSDTFILSLDSISKKGDNLPDADFSDEEIDNLINYIKLNFKDKTLIVLSHYPMIKFDRAQYEAEDLDWEKLHFWKKSYFFIERLYKIREKNLTLYFFGDGHVQDFKSYNDFHHFHLTGMIGGSFSKRTYKDSSGEEISFNKTNVVRLVSIDDKKEAKNPIIIHTISHESNGYTYSPHTGSWQTKTSKIRLEQSPFLRTNQKVETFNPSQEDIVTSISSSVEDEILKIIKTKKLYTLGRHMTSSQEATLGWVSMNGVFSDSYILDSCVVKGKQWIKENIINSNKENTILIGVDFWGAILASRISVISEINNYSTIARSEGKHHDRFEDIVTFCSSKLIKMKNIINIVLITDVIGTGKTINYVKNKIEEILGRDMNFFLISIITDSKSIDTVLTSNFIKIGIYCSKLKIPRISSKDLPDETILPAKTDFR